MTDPIADYLTRLRNAIMAHHRVVEVPASNLKNPLREGLHPELQVHRGWSSGYYQGCFEVQPSYS